MPELFFHWPCEEGSLRNLADSSTVQGQEGRPRASRLLSSQRFTDMTNESNHPTSGRRRRHKSPAAVPQVHDLPLPLLLNQMGADEDGPSCSEDEKDAKRLRSASTTPRSQRGTHPNDYDQVMRVTSVDSQESVRFGEEDGPVTGEIPDEMVHNSADLDETHDNDQYHDANPWC